MQTNSVEKVKYKLGFDSILCVDCMGKGNVLALLWKTEITLEIQSFSIRDITSWIQERHEREEWMLTYFYIHLEVGKRMEGQDILRYLNQLKPYMQLRMGDFNEIMYRNDEKYGGC